MSNQPPRSYQRDTRLSRKKETKVCIDVIIVLIFHDTRHLRCKRTEGKLQLNEPPQKREKKKSVYKGSASVSIAKQANTLMRHLGTGVDSKPPNFKTCRHGMDHAA